MIKIELQNYVKNSWAPTKKAIQQWMTCALKGIMDEVEICVRLVSPDEIQEVNRHYRHKDKPTNVISFPYSIADDPERIPQLGDIMICPEVLQQEAKEQKKELMAHWAHIVVHGTLHLVGFDHIRQKDARLMRDKEKEVLAKLGFEIDGGDD